MDIFINFIKVILMGIVEGITEWLPISSTGHMIILEQWIGLEDVMGANLWEFFLVVIQLGAILAVIFNFFSRLWPFGKNKSQEEKRGIWYTWLNIVVACIPAAIIGFLLDDWLNANLYNFITVSIMLIFYGIAFIVIEEVFKKKKVSFKIDDVKNMSWKVALIIGFAQVLAMIPGTSRSGVTILSAMLLGCNRKTSAEFSFFLSIPVMLGASLFKGIKFIHSGSSISGIQIAYIVVGCIVAFVVSIVAIRMLLKFIKKNSFIGFGYYRIGLGVVLIVYYVVCLNTGNSELVNSSTDFITHNFISLSNLANIPILLK
ncbi:MAG: undecaprenyl-diphosphate phosphatase [Bacilli bacterium]|nr:undecaprenyl-diphosphate phosphatase [Bacilli bacterium]